MSPGLAYVALSVTEVEAAATIFEQHLGLARREARTPRGQPVPIFSVGQSALALFQAGDPFLEGHGKSGVHHIAIAVADPEAAARATGSSPVPPVVEGLDGSHELRLDGSDTCGVRTRLCTAFEHQSPQVDIVERIDHVGVASADNAAATAMFAGRLGLKVESTQTDSEVVTAMESFTSDRYGVVYHTRAPEIVGGLRVTFITVGDCELEFLEPFAATVQAESADRAVPRGPGTTRGDKGAIGRYIQRRGPGLHHLALKTPDIDATLAALAQAGVALIDRSGRPGSRRARIGFMDPRGLGGVLVHFVERDEL